MADKEPIKQYEVSSEHFNAFTVSVHKGKVIHCSDDSHPQGSDFKSLKEYYETRQYKCEVKEVGNEQTVS